MSGCEKYSELASAYLDRELEGGEPAELERHLAQCPACRALFEGFKETGRAAREIGQPGALEWDEVWNRIQARAERQSAVHIIQARIWKRAAWTAAAAALLIGIYVFGPHGARSVAEEGPSFEVVSLEVESGYTPFLMTGDDDQLPVLWLERI